MSDAESLPFGLEPVIDIEEPAWTPASSKRSLTDVTNCFQTPKHQVMKPYREKPERDVMQKMSEVTEMDVWTGRGGDLITPLERPAAYWLNRGKGSKSTKTSKTTKTTTKKSTVPTSATTTQLKTTTVTSLPFSPSIVGVTPTMPPNTNTCSLPTAPSPATDITGISSLLPRSLPTYSDPLPSVGPLPSVDTEISYNLEDDIGGASSVSSYLPVRVDKSVVTESGESSYVKRPSAHPTSDFSAYLDSPVAESRDSMGQESAYLISISRESSYLPMGPEKSARSRSLAVSETSSYVPQGATTDDVSISGVSSYLPMPGKSLATSELSSLPDTDRDDTNSSLLSEMNVSSYLPATSRGPKSLVTSELSSYQPKPSDSSHVPNTSYVGVASSFISPSVLVTPQVGSEAGGVSALSVTTMRDTMKRKAPSEVSKRPKRLKGTRSFAGSGFLTPGMESAYAAASAAYSPSFAMGPPATPLPPFNMPQTPASVASKVSTGSSSHPPDSVANFTPLKPGAQMSGPTGAFASTQTPLSQIDEASWKTAAQSWAHDFNAYIKECDEVEL